MIYGYDMNSLIEQGANHWEEYLPEKFQALTQAGTLEQELRAAASLTLKEMDLLISSGASAHEAWEQCRENHLILPEEESEEEPEERTEWDDLHAEINQLQRDIADDPDMQ